MWEFYRGTLLSPFNSALLADVLNNWLKNFLGKKTQEHLSPHRNPIHYPKHNIVLQQYKYSCSQL